MVGSTLLQLVFGIWIALVLNNVVRGQRIFSALAFSLYLIPTIIVMLLALYLVDPFYGAIPAVLEPLGLVDQNEYILGNIDWAMPIVIIISSWKFAVFITILVTAQLQSIPDQFYEVGKICGATRYEMFRDVTLPRIKGAILIGVFLRSVFMFTKFDVIWILTKGGPGDATTTLPIIAYRRAFIQGFYGQANAIAVVMFVLLLAGGIGYFKYLSPSEEVETET
jgi:multiple sugar transport system permease protein